jgi:hypothetical protein
VSVTLGDVFGRASARVRVWWGVGGWGGGASASDGGCSDAVWVHVVLQPIRVPTNC